MRIKIIETKDPTLGELVTLHTLVVSGGQIKLVPSILMKQICSCKYWGIVYDEINIIACAAIKVPQSSYIKKVFDNAKYNQSELFDYEIGYFITLPEYRGKRYMSELVSELMIRMSLTNLFATTQSPAAAKILIKNGFEQQGITHNNIDLYTYEV